MREELSGKEDTMTEPTEEDILLSNIDRGTKVVMMLQHKGWQEVIGPWIYEQRQSYLRTALDISITPAEREKAIFKVHGLDSLTNYILAITNLGERSAGQLKESKENEES